MSSGGTIYSAASSLGVGLLDAALAEHLDATDPLRHLRAEFHVPKMATLPHVNLDIVKKEDEAIYLVGNSLGLQPKRLQSHLQKELDKWANMGAEGHFTGDLPWALCDEKLIPAMARVVGAQENEIGLMNGLTVNLHLLLAHIVEISFYRPSGSCRKIVLEARAFPSDHYAVESQIRLQGGDPADCMVLLEPRAGETCLRTDDVLAAIAAEGPDIAVVLLSGIQYYTGQLFDIPAITDAARAAGAVVGWDLAHVAGNVPLRLHDWGPDFAVWCTYKYLNSGAGGLGGLFLHERHARHDHPRLVGWWGHRLSSRFRMDNRLELSDGPDGYRISNPPALLAAALKASLELFDTTTMEELREKSLRLTAYLEALLVGPDSPLKDELKLVSPSDPSQRGAQLSLAFTRLSMADVFKALTQRGVLIDKREPDVIRVAPAPMYNSFIDVRRFFDALQASIQSLREGGDSLSD